MLYRNGKIFLYVIFFIELILYVYGFYKSDKNILYYQKLKLKLESENNLSC